MKVCCDTEGRELTDERRYAPTSVPLRRKPCSRSPETLFHFTGIPNGDRESPWHFGTGSQYPVLALDVDGNGQTTWQEMGHQLREGPTLAVSGGESEAVLTWTAVDTSHWTAAPRVRYTVFRDYGLGMEILEAGLDGLEYTDRNVAAGTDRTYQVVALVAGGEAAWSAPATPGGGGGPGGPGGRRNRPPEAVGILPDRALETGSRPLLVAAASAFRDPDGDPLTYAAESSAGHVATAEATGSVVTLAPVAVGEAAITVTATDAGGSNRTAVQTFTVTIGCGYAVAPTHRDVLWTLGTGEVMVTTAPGWAWTAASESAFLTLTGETAGTGSGTATYSVAPNAGGPRAGALRVAGQRVTVFQASPTVFTDHLLEPGVTPIKAIHFLELRARIDALRARDGLAAFAWTAPALTAGTPIRAVHLTELRTALAEAYAAAGRTVPAWTDAAVTAGTTVIGAAHMMELRDAVLILEQ